MILKYGMILHYDNNFSGTALSFSMKEQQELILKRKAHMNSMGLDAQNTRWSFESC